MSSDVTLKVNVNGRQTSSDTALAASSTKLSSSLATMSHPMSPSSSSSLISSSRRLHALLAPTALILISFALITGEVYRFSRNALGVSKNDIGYVLSLHSMQFDKLHHSLPSFAAYYPLVTTCIVLPLIVSGIIMTVTQSWSLTYAYDIMTSSWRVTHRSYVLIATVPLLLTVMSACVWSVAHDWLNYDKAELQWIMYIHQGTYLYDPVVYTTLLALLMIPVMISGAMLISDWFILCVYPIITIRHLLGYDDGATAESGSTIQRDRSRYTLLSVNRALEVERLMAPLSNSSSDAEESTTPERRSDRSHRYSR